MTHESTMIEKVARAIEPNAFIAFEAGRVTAAQMQPLYDKARAVLEVLREPTPAMLRDGWESAPCSWDSRTTPDCDALIEPWQAIIDSILAEGGG